MGKIMADSLTAAFVAPSKGKIYITDCYNAGKVTGASRGFEFANSDYVLELQNCYDAYSNQVERVIPVDVMSGALCFLLNTGSGNDLWRQNIDNGRKPDGHPVLKSSSGVVYYKDGIYTNINNEVQGYRYYKWEINSIRNGNRGTIQFAEFDILDEDGNEYPNVFVYNGTDSDIPNEDWPNAGDNDIYTKYCGTFRGYAYFLYDAGEEVVPYGYRIYTANDTRNCPDRNPTSWRLYGSNSSTEDPDADCWVLIDEQMANSTLQAVNYTPFDFMLTFKNEETSVNTLTPSLTPKGESDVYDLGGRKMFNAQGSTPKGSRANGENKVAMLNGLKKGIYIVNGKKVVVK